MIDLTDYSAVAPEYDNYYSDSGSRAEDWVVARWLSWLGASRGLSVLDFGCGTGALLRSGVIRGRYLGVDPSTGMIQQARQKWPGREFLNCPPNAIPVANAAFSIVVAAWSLCCCRSEEELSAELLEIRRLLAPGGAFLGLWPGSFLDRRTQSFGYGEGGWWWDERSKRVVFSLLPGVVTMGLNPWGSYPPRVGPLLGPLMLMRSLLGGSYDGDACHVLMIWRAPS